MATSEAKRRANYKYNRKNSHILSVKMQNWEFEIFKASCAAAGVTPHSVFLSAARAFISTHPAPDSGGGSGPADAGGLSAPSDAPTSGGAADTSSGTDAAGHGSGADSVGAGHDPASGSGTSGAAAV